MTTKSMMLQKSSILLISQGMQKFPEEELIIPGLEDDAEARDLMERT
jgi:hypothetical protein